MLFFAINVFAEIPHSYVTENPDKEVTQTETLKKYKEKAELNISVTKLNSEEIEGSFDPGQNKVYFSLDNTKYGIEPGDHIYVSEELQEVPSISTTNGRRKINGMLNQKVLKDGNLEYTVTNKNNTTEIEVSYSNNKRELKSEKGNTIYLGILDSQYKIKKILNGKNISNVLSEKPTFINEIIPPDPYTEIKIKFNEQYSGNEFILNRNTLNPNVTCSYTGKDFPYCGAVIFPRYKWWIAIRTLKINDVVFKAKDPNENNSGFFPAYGIGSITKKVGNMTITAKHIKNEKTKVLDFALAITNIDKENFSLDIKASFYYSTIIDVNHPNQWFPTQITNEGTYHLNINNKISKIIGESNLIVDETYKPEYIPFTSCTIENQEDIGLEKTITGVTLSQTSGKGLITLQQNDILEVNGKQYVVGTGGSLTEQSDTLGKINYSFKVENGKLRLRVDKYGLQINTAQPLSLKVTRDGKEVMTHTMNIKVPYVEKIIGESFLEVKEYYPSPEYIAFNSCSINSPQDIALENNLRDVKLTQTSGKGLVGLEQSDILEINGKNYTIGAGGNLPEQSDTLGNINFKFKVEAGKVRLALTSWGVLEPDRVLTINAKKNTNVELMEHRMTIKAPRRVEGTSTLKFNEKYPIRDIVKFQGISLTAPNIGGIEPPIPNGVSYKSDDGYGIPFMKEGDILEVQCETMRATQKYIIDSKNSLKHQTIDLPGTVLSLLVEDGKLRLGLNNWLVNKNAVLNFRVIRGVNEISNTSITLEVPKAPFDILKNGILDFGKLIQGSKNKKAETSILLEMHQDISNVKFSLSTTTPELVNSSGATLHARDLQAGVQKQGKKRHLVRIIGRLDVPEKQELGVYRGSVLLNVTIK